MSALTLLMLTLLAPRPARAQTAYTLYELLEPGSARFAITYDVTTARSGAAFFLNPIRVGSVATDESVIDLATGEELQFEVVTGKEAKAEGLVGARTADDSEYIKVHLAKTVPENGEARLRIIKTYEDAESYWVDGDTVVFDRSLGIRANGVVLPPGYEIIESATPGMVSTLPDGRIKITFLNDRDDSLGVRVVGRHIGGSAGAEAGR